MSGDEILPPKRARLETINNQNNKNNNNINKNKLLVLLEEINHSVQQASQLATILHQHVHPHKLTPTPQPLASGILFNSSVLSLSILLTYNIRV